MEDALTETTDFTKQNNSTNVDSYRLKNENFYLWMEFIGNISI